MAMIRAKSQNIVKGAKKRAYINKAARKIDNPKMEGVYSGDKLDGLRHGLGTLTFPNGDKYVGQFD